MQHDFWHQKWINNDIGFHREEVNPFLLKYYPLFNRQQRSRVLVPLCGKSKDMIWLNQQNATVIGCELSELACQQFFVENNLALNRFEGSEFNLYKHAGLELLAGDFFKLSEQLTGKLDGCYDRAALVALPAELRQSYARKMSELLTTGSWYLLVVFNFEDSSLFGPPFKVGDNEIQELFSADFAIDFLEEQPESVRDLVGGGKVEFSQRVYILQRK